VGVGVRALLLVEEVVTRLVDGSFTRSLSKVV
jgi:hypothetical protein